MPKFNHNQAAQSKRFFLIQLLGGECKKCGRRIKLEFHHPFGITWIARKVNQWTRIKRYEREARQGLIELLCTECNKTEGRPFRED